MRNYWLKASSVLIIICTIGCAANLPQGEVLYLRECAQCHMDQGQGLSGVIPPLERSDYLKENMDLLPCIIKNGLNQKIKVNQVDYSDPMPSHPDLSDHEVINIVNYINQKWDYGAPFLTPKIYAQELSLCDTLHKH